jgi:dTDP-4-dehydrorhamnose 3,5-epimerase
MRFELKPAKPQGLMRVDRKPLGDSRGYLERLFCEDELRPLFENRVIRQINRTLTKTRGTVRGMHFQHPPHAEAKLVSCLRGRVFDVAVDLRRGSPTFLQWHSEILDDENHRALFIPEGFAHGFQTLSEHCEMLYMHTAVYDPDSEGAINALDPVLAIVWPETIQDRSPRDTNHPMLAADYPGIDLDPKEVSKHKGETSS